MMNGVKAVAKKYNEVSLILRIVAGLVIGAVPVSYTHLTLPTT